VSKVVDLLWLVLCSYQSAKCDLSALSHDQNVQINPVLTHHRPETLRTPDKTVDHAINYPIFEVGSCQLYVNSEVKSQTLKSKSQIQPQLWRTIGGCT